MRISDWSSDVCSSDLCRNVYLTGIVRDKQGRKMSKSLGNSPEPQGLIDKYGADGVRVGMLLSSPAGNDLLFDESLCEQGRNFANQIWNAYRLIQGWEVETGRAHVLTPIPNAFFLHHIRLENNKQYIIYNNNYIKHHK